MFRYFILPIIWTNCVVAPPLIHMRKMWEEIETSYISQEIMHMKSLGQFCSTVIFEKDLIHAFKYLQISVNKRKIYYLWSPYTYMNS